MLENGGLSGPESKQSLVSVQSTNLNFNLNSVTPSDKVTIQNLNKTRIAWKLQTTSPTRYYISPSCGFLTPQETVVVTVTLLNAKKFNDRQRFLITAAVAPESSKNRKEFWAHPIDFSHLHCIRILAESGDAKAPPDANAVAGSAPPSDPVATARSPTIITESNEQKTADAPKEDTTQLVTEIHGMVETKSTTTRKMLEAVNSVKKIEMELDKIAVVTKKEKYMLNQAVTTLEEEQCDDEDVDVDVESDGIVKTKPSLLPSPCNSEEDEPQMTTPEDPVIHSPPSLRAPAINSPSSIAAALSHNSPLNGYGSPNGCDESRTSCESPGSACDSNGDLDARRRQKTCRVCGDHATGYNFNVITCESCKAFFRRNALRPKEFKCPYSEDCDINAVSRRFCQKCRLRKCFSVGMKKEWILNEEQLRRRKNSRLNNMQSQQRLRHQHDVTNKIMQQAQLHSPPGRGLVPMMSPPGSQFPLLSPTDSNNSDSPPRPIASLLQGQHSPDYEPSMLMQQRLAAARAAATAAAAAVSPLPTSFSAPAPLRPSTTQRISVDPVKNTVMLSMDEYNSLVQMASNGVSPLGASGIDGSPEYKPNVFSPMNSLASPIANGISSSSSSSYANLDALNVAKAEGIVKDDNDRFKLFLDNAITEEMRANESPDYNVSIKRNNMSNGDRINYQLNTAELRALDIVREAFSGMNEPLDAGRQRESFMKADKTPTDIMNIMDITMRRLVKMAKKLPAFNELSNEGKFAMLKGGMVEMLTVRGVARFDSTSNSWKTPVVPNQYGVSVNMFDQLNMNNRDIQKTRFVSFVRSLHEDLRKNELAVNLLMLIVLFTRRENVQCTEDDAKMIEKHHREYVSLLNRYLESLYGEDARKLQEILPRAIDLLHVIGKNSITLFMGTVKPEEAEPLPREFFKTSDD